MAKKTVRFNKGGLGQLPDNKPVLYRIQTEGGRDSYVGIAKRGRVQARITEHLGEIPGAKGPGRADVTDSGCAHQRGTRNCSGAAEI